MSDERRYSEAELHAIFERAAKRQEEAGRAEAASRGQLTLAELQEIGAASGIDPAHIAAAASELTVDPPRDVPTFLGAPTEVERTRVLPYAVSDEAWGKMVAEIRRTFDDDGSIGQIGQMREWTAVKRVTNNSGTAMRLALEPLGDGRTKATLRQSVRETTKGFTIATAINAAMALVFAVIALLTVEPEMWIAVAITAVMALAFAGVTRGWLGVWGAKQQEKFDGVLDRLDLIGRDAAPDAVTPDPISERRTRSEDRIDLDALRDEESATSPSQRRRTRS